MSKTNPRTTALSRLRVAATTIAFLLGGCGGATTQTEAAEPSAPEAAEQRLPEPRVEEVLTEQERDALSPQQIVQMLREGNARFVAGDLTVRDHTAQVRAAALGQAPKASVLSCIDSRVPVEDVFDRGIGDIFVARVAGNFETEEILGSMEFGSAMAGARVLLVLGHEHCGAVKGAIVGADLGHLGETLANIQPAVEHFKDYEGERSASNEEFVHMVAEQNVRLTVADIRERSKVLRELEEQGDLVILGAMYDMDTGRVTLLDEGT